MAHAPVTWAQTAAKVPVLASFSILADLAREIGGDRIDVTSLIGPNEDAHGFQPSPAHIKLAGEAKIILINGLGFEPYLPRLLKSAGIKNAPVVASAGIAPLKKAKSGHGHDHEHGATREDPHAWQSIRNIRVYAGNIAKALIAHDPEGKAGYDARLAAYVARLDTLDAELRGAIAAIPVERRVLTTTHDAFQYLAAEYGLKVQALQGVSAENEPSAADMARIIRQLRALKAPAVFLENVSDPRKLEQIARESGARIGGTLHSDALSLANGPAPTYIDMMRQNVAHITKALTP